MRPIYIVVVETRWKDRWIKGAYLDIEQARTEAETWARKHSSYDYGVCMYPLKYDPCKSYSITLPNEREKWPELVVN